MGALSTGYAGVFKILAETPMWTIVLVFLVIGTSLGLAFIIGDRTNGIYFNTSYSSVVGDLCLSVILLIGVTVLQRGEPLPAWMLQTGVHLGLVVLALAIGYVINTKAPAPYAWSERYHSFVVVPFYIVMLPLMTLAIIYGGTEVEKKAALALLVSWLALVVYDFADGRIDQRKWVAEKFGVEFTAKGAVKPREPPP